MFDRNAARKRCHVDKIRVPQIGKAVNKKKLKTTIYTVRHYTLLTRTLVVFSGHRIFKQGYTALKSSITNCNVNLQLNSVITTSVCVTPRL